MAFALTSQILFLSTPSGWRATNVAIDDRHCARISIHALRVEGDNLVADRNVAVENFYPRPPGGGRLIDRLVYDTVRRISIHALRVEGDSNSSIRCIGLREFLSTPSGWRATLRGGGWLPEIKFLSTPSGWRATERRFLRSARYVDFYPRPPGGGRQFRHKRV